MVINEHKQGRQRQEHVMDVKLKTKIVHPTTENYETASGLCADDGICCAVPAILRLLSLHVFLAATRFALCARCWASNSKMTSLSQSVRSIEMQNESLIMVGAGACK